MANVRAPAAAAPDIPASPRSRVVQITAPVLERHRITSVTTNKTADAFRLLRTELLMQMRKNGWQTLAVTSPNKGAGKSTVSLNLAFSFAGEVDYSAMLVDADLRDPDLRNLLELEPGPGLADHLLGKATLGDILIRTDFSELVMLPGSAPATNTSELLRSPMMANMIRTLRWDPTRIIVFDVPPILAGADSLALSAYMDATILLVEECKTTREDLERSCALLRNSNLIGIVLNKSRQLRESDPITRPKPGLIQRIFGADD